MGKIVAPGGKLELGESPAEAARREVHEEVGLDLLESNLRLVGEITYLFPTKPEWNQKSWVFFGPHDAGEPSLSAELDAAWVPMEQVPLGEMWDDAQYWLMDVLNGGRVSAFFTFGRDLSTVVDSDHPAFSRPI